MSRENSCIAEPRRTSAVYQSAILSQVSATEPSAYGHRRRMLKVCRSDVLRMPIGAGRRRYGHAADDYARYRPRYPRSLIDGLVESGHLRALDVGAGTGIASAQLIEAGAEVLAVEPDSRMAQVATKNGIHTEQATFEDWKPAGRSFDLVASPSVPLGTATARTREGRVNSSSRRTTRIAVETLDSCVADTAGTGRGLRRPSRRVPACVLQRTARIDTR